MIPPKGYGNHDHIFFVWQATERIPDRLGFARMSVNPEIHVVGAHGANCETNRIDVC